jgi:hypothetical protein
MELILESDSDAHSSEDEDISAQSDTDADNNTDDITDINFTQWTGNTNCRPTVPVVHRFAMAPRGYNKQTYPTSKTNLP